MRTGQLAAQSFLRNPRNIEDFTLKKQASGSRDETGVFDPGAESILSLTGSVQPLDGKSRLELPEGERLLDSICVLLLTNDSDLVSPIRTGTQQTDSDIIVYNGFDWAVRVVHNMADYGHLEIYATRLENQDG